ncbi:MAG TPA: YciI family protein [Anaeromyxobacteraceae bacterium]|nr:YciI family protein [Anaeromyxobacteraceae bacterium]
MAAFMFIFRGSNTRSDSPEQMQQHMQKWLSWFEGLSKSGAYKGQGAPLEPVGKVVRGTRKTVSDGPYAEAKDLVGGYAIVEARDLEAAIEIARGCPTYEKDGAVEVRPVRVM